MPTGTTTKATPPDPRRNPGPVRTCVGCRRRAPTTELVRVTRACGGIEVGGPSRGRGAWLCATGRGGIDAECVRLALARRGFERAWRGAIGDDERTMLASLARRAPGDAAVADAP